MSDVQNPAGREPRIVFFTGGTALRDVSRALAGHTRRCAHLVTAFDSGGSTASLRRSFDMPAVGDVRNRMLALADPAVVPECVLDVCRHRLPAQGDAEALCHEIRAYAAPEHAVWAAMPERFALPLRAMLAEFAAAMPESFDPRLAILGNLMLAGGYFAHGRELAPVLDFWTELLAVRGLVLPITRESLHLAAVLADGSVLVGQHKFCRLGQPVRRLFLAPWKLDCGMDCGEKLAEADPRAVQLIGTADAICYPMGSFYTSVVANLLPRGIAHAVAEAPCRKFYIANSGHDAEQCGHSVADRVRVILDTLRRQEPDMPASRLLSAVLVDTRRGRYSCGIDQDGIEAQGVRVVDVPLLTDDPQHHEPELTAQAILRVTRGEL